MWMWTKVQQKQKQRQRQRERHDFDDSSVDFEVSKIKSSFENNDDDESWEEQAFAEDAAGHGLFGGCVWPPRSYFCSFCRREFRSAQALGGHMNVHRRDRARLKQSPNSNHPQFPFISFPSSSSSPPHHQLPSTLPYHLPNPKITTSYPFHSSNFPTSSTAVTDDILDLLPTGVISCGDHSDYDSNVEKREPRARDKDHVGSIGVFHEGLNFDFHRPRPMLDVSDDGPEEAKRRKTDDGTTSIQFYVKSTSLVERHHRRHHHIQSEVIGISSSSLHDLDLELRLGGLSKG